MSDTSFRKGKVPGLSTDEESLHVDPLMSKTGGFLEKQGTPRKKGGPAEDEYFLGGLNQGPTQKATGKVPRLSTGEESLQPGVNFPWLLRWCELDFIHPQA